MVGLFNADAVVLEVKAVKELVEMLRPVIHIFLGV